MTLLKITQIGHPVLRQVAKPVSDVSDPALQQLMDDMVATMLDAPGIGLAAPQVYHSTRLIVFSIPAERLGPDDPPAPDEISILVNPEFESLDDEQVTDVEGCLSIPQLRGLTPRFQRIIYRGLDREGRPIEREAEGIHARVVQHEIDHLDGVLFLDRMCDLKALAVDDELHHVLRRTEQEREE
ncbi:MAG: peptide deformylase [Pseudomonadota bacterium]